MVQPIQPTPLYIKPKHSDAALVTGVVLTVITLTVAGIALAVFLSRLNNLAAQGPNPLVAPGATAGRAVVPGTVLEPLAIGTTAPKVILIISGTATGVLGLSTISYAIYRRHHPTMSHRARQYIESQREIEEWIVRPKDPVRERKLYELLGTQYTYTIPHLTNSSVLKYDNQFKQLVNSRAQELPAIAKDDVIKGKAPYVAGRLYLAQRILSNLA